jgi:large subunit ribosomal protein L13
MKTLMLKPTDLQPKWWIVDASDLVVGRMSARIAQILMGKANPQYTPHLVCGDMVVVINAEKCKLTGTKWQNKVYDKYTGYVGGRKTATASELRDKRPEIIIEHAVWRMLPKNKLQKQMMRRLKIYVGPSHPHQAQSPEQLKINA